ncbi:MAG TPA: ABC transporter substrate-binding protein, partial [Hyphomonadaceae bacterium]|nr:ABC transporter substrate-binding protein [Hyphomonadaceae bacterium]
MKLTMRVATATIALLAGSAFSPAFAQNTNQPDDDLPGRIIYEENCAACHDNPAD